MIRTVESAVVWPLLWLLTLASASRRLLVSAWRALLALVLVACLWWARTLKMPPRSAS
jgi:hypothetical protein